MNWETIGLNKFWFVECRRDAIEPWTDLWRADPVSRVLITLADTTAARSPSQWAGPVERALDAGIFRHAYVVLPPGLTFTPLDRLTPLQDGSVRPSDRSQVQSVQAHGIAANLVDENVMEHRVDHLAKREGVLTSLRYVLDIELRFFALMAPVPATLQQSFRHLVEHADAVTLVREEWFLDGASLTSEMAAALEDELRVRLATACDVGER